MMQNNRHFDLEILAKIRIFFEVLADLLNPTNSVVRKLLIAAAFEQLATELRQQAAEQATAEDERKRSL